MLRAALRALPGPGGRQGVLPQGRCPQIGDDLSGVDDAAIDEHGGVGVRSAAVGVRRVDAQELADAVGARLVALPPLRRAQRPSPRSRARTGRVDDVDDDGAPLRVDDDVRGADVAVDDPRLVQRADAGGHPFPHPPAGARRAQRVRGEGDVERAALDVLLDDRPLPVLVADDVEQADHVRGVDAGPRAPAVHALARLALAPDRDDAGALAGLRQPQRPVGAHVDDGAEFVPSDFHGPIFPKTSM